MRHRLLSFARWSYAYVTFAVTLAAGAVLVTVNATGVTGYSEADTSQLLLALLWTGPIMAGVVAWNASRTRGFTRNAERFVRSPARVSIDATFPTFFATSLSTLALGPLTKLLPLGSVSWRLMGIALLSLLATAAVAATLGTCLRPALAVAVSALGAFCWYALTSSSGPPSFAQLTGVFVQCCTPEQMVTTRQLAAVTVCAATVCAVSLLAMTRRRSLVTRLFITVGGICAALIVGTLVVPTPDDRFSLGERQGQQRCLDDGGYTICAWPEHGDVLKTLAPRVVPALKAWQSLGLSQRSTFSEGATAPASSDISLVPGAAVSDIVRSAAQGLVPYVDDCYEASETSASPASPSDYDALVDWLTVQAGLSPKPTPALASVLGRPESEQINWFRQQKRRLTECT